MPRSVIAIGPHLICADAQQMDTPTGALHVRSTSFTGLPAMATDPVVTATVTNDQGGQAFVVYAVTIVRTADDTTINVEAQFINLSDTGAVPIPGVYTCSINAVGLGTDTAVRPSGPGEVF